MKYFLPLFLAVSLSFASSDAMAIRKQIDRYITADNGCRFHVTGWVEFSVSWSGVRVSDYDVTMDGPCGRFRFEGLVSSDGNGTTITAAKLYNLDTEKVEDVASSPFLGSVVVQLEKDLNE